jgi:hypothetical protein
VIGRTSTDTDADSDSPVDMQAPQWVEVKNASTLLCVQ